MCCPCNPIKKKLLKERRDKFRSRLAISVLDSCSENHKDALLASYQKKKALDQLESQHGIKRNGAACAELPCVVFNHLHQDEHGNETCEESEVKKHVDQHGGFSIRLFK